MEGFGGLSFFFMCTLMQQALLALCVYLPFRCGLLTLATPAFYGIGGYAAALVSTRYFVGDDFVHMWGGFGFSASISFFVCYFIAKVLASFLLSLQGVYLGLATISLVEIIRVLVMNSDFLGGAIGVFGIPPLFESNVSLLVFWTMFLLCVIFLFLYLAQRTRWGVSLDAVREDEIAAQSIGISAEIVKAKAFCWSAGIAGVVGVASAHLLGTWNPRQVTFDQSVTSLSYVIMGGGGGGSWFGTVAGAWLLGAVPEVLRPLSESRLLFNGIVLFAVAVYFPSGFSGFFRFLRSSIRTKVFSSSVSLRAPKKSESSLVQETFSTELFKDDNLDGSVLLTVDSLTCRFGGVTALNSVTFSVFYQEIFGVIGPNGAGKSSLFNALSGLVIPVSGSLTLNGAVPIVLDVHVSSSQRARQGIARTFQNIRLFKGLSAEENILLALGKGSSKDLSYQELLAFFEFDFDLKQPAGQLAYGDQRRLEIARAMALKPRLLLLDEPAAGMNPSEKNALVTLLRRLRQHFRVTIMIIEHHVPTMMNLCDRIAVLHHGELLDVDVPLGIQRNKNVIDAYLGHKQ